VRLSSATNHFHQRSTIGFSSCMLASKYTAERNLELIDSGGATILALGSQVLLTLKAHGGDRVYGTAAKA